MTSANAETVVQVTQEQFLAEGMPAAPIRKETDNGKSIDVALHNRFTKEYDRRSKLAATDPEFWSWAIIQQKTGIDKSAISKWHGEKPEGNVAKLEAKLREFMDHAIRRAMLPEQPSFVLETGPFKLVRKTIEAVKFGGWFGLVTGPSGVGLTVAGTDYADTFPNALWSRCTSWNRYPWTIASSLFGQFTNRKKARGFRQQMEYMVEELTPKKGVENPTTRVIVIDEGELLTASAWRLLRDLHVVTKTPVVVLANHLAAERVRALPKIANAIDMHVEIERSHGRYNEKTKSYSDFFTAGEIAEFVGHYVPNPPAELVETCKSEAEKGGHLLKLRAPLQTMKMFLSRAGNDPLKAFAMANKKRLAA